MAVENAPRWSESASRYSLRLDGGIGAKHGGGTSVRRRHPASMQDPLPGPTACCRRWASIFLFRLDYSLSSVRGFPNQRLSDSWAVGLRRSDRCDVMHYATISGIESRIFCPVAKAMSGARRRITGYSWRPFCSAIERASRGVIFRSVSVIGKSSTSASAGGPRAGFSSAFSNCWRAIMITNT